MTDNMVNAANVDEIFELRELLHLSHDKRFSEFFGLGFGTVSDDGSAIVGHGGLLFVNDGSNKWRQQLSGEFVPDDALLKESGASLDNISKTLGARGVAFYWCVVPEKDLLYPEASPNAAKIVQARPVHMIGRNTSVRHIYPLQNLTALRAKCFTHLARNSHISVFGGLTIANAVLSMLKKDPIDFDDLSFRFVFWPDDLSLKWVPELKTRRRMVASPARENYINRPHGHVGTHLELINESAPVSETLLIFGDSYAWNPDAGLARFLSLRFQRVVFIWSSKVDYSLIDQVRPSLVILEMAERFLSRGIK